MDLLIFLYLLPDILISESESISPVKSIWSTRAVTIEKGDAIPSFCLGFNTCLNTKIHLYNYYKIIIYDKSLVCSSPNKFHHLHQFCLLDDKEKYLHMLSIQLLPLDSRLLKHKIFAGRGHQSHLTNRISWNFELVIFSSLFFFFNQ